MGTITIKKYQNKNEKLPKCYKKWYGKVVHRGTMSTDELANHIMKHGSVHALQNFLCRCLVVPAVVDVHVHIVHAEVLQAAVDVAQYMLPTIDAVRDFLLCARELVAGEDVTEEVCFKTNVKMAMMLGLYNSL